MRESKVWVLSLLVLILVIVLGGCGTSDQELMPSESAAASASTTASTAETAASAVSVPTPKEEPCYGIPEWVDFLMINDIKYYSNSEDAKPVSEELIGEKVGEISYMLEGHACADHMSKNGDAAYLPTGTAVYELKGYKPEFRVVANNKIYQASENPEAKTMGELLDIEGKVDKISLESGMDGSPIGDFSPEASSEFVNELLSLPLVGSDKVYEKVKHEYGVFLRVHLQDGTSFRLVFYPNGNGFIAGAFATEELKTLIMTQRAQIKQAAGL